MMTAKVHYCRRAISAQKVTTIVNFVPNLVFWNVLFGRNH